MNILDKNISELMDLMDKEEITNEEIIKIYLKNIFEKGLDKKVYKSLCEEESIEKAKEIDMKRKNGEKLGALAGIPIAVTEDISTKGILTEAGSKILKDYIPPFNATIIEKLSAEDAIILGKIKISEFSLEDREYSVRCILDKGALAVIGSDREGKNVAKLQPSYGLVSRYGIISATSSLSPLTLIAKGANDLALVLNAISGYDKRDSTSVDLGTQRDDDPCDDCHSKHRQGIPDDFKCGGHRGQSPWSTKIDQMNSPHELQGNGTQGDGSFVGSPHGLQENEAKGDDSDTGKTARAVSKVKIPKELLNDDLVKDIKELGIDVEESTIETGKYILPAFKILSSAEFASATARYDGIRYGYRSDNYENREELYKNTRSEGFGKEAKKTIIFGNHVINAEQYDRYYKKSQKIRSLIKDEIDKILEDGSILLLPLSDDLDENLKEGYKELGSMTGYPMLSIPYRSTEDEYMELYMLSSSFDEKTLIQLANQIEKGLDSHGKRQNRYIPDCKRNEIEGEFDSREKQHNRYTPDCKRNKIEKKLDSREKQHNRCIPDCKQNEAKKELNSHGGDK